MYTYQIEKNGINYVKNEIFPKLHNYEVTITLLERFKTKIVTSSIKDILYYVYNKYPKYTEKSLIKEEILNNESLQQL